MDSVVNKATYRDPVPIKGGSPAKLVTPNQKDPEHPYKWADSPWISLFDKSTLDTNTQSFTDYLMYHPNGGIWVTLSALRWTWQATAQWNQGIGWQPQVSDATKKLTGNKTKGDQSSALPVWFGTLPPAKRPIP